MNKIMQRFSITLNDFMLNEITENIENFRTERIVNLFKDCYSSSDPGILRAATMLNSIFTHRTLTFMVTKRRYNKLLADDINHTKKEVSGTIYNLFMENVTKNGMIKQLRTPTNGKAGVYKLIDPDMISMMKELHVLEVTEAFDEMMNFDKIQSQKEESVLDYYDSKDIKPKKSKEDIKNEIRNKINERFKERQGE